MEALRDWIVGIVAAAFLTAIAQAVCPEGTVKRVTRMAGGLIMVLAVVRPLLQVQGVDISLAQTEYDKMIKEETARLGQVGNSLLQQLIEEKTAAYILTEVQTRKLSLSVSVRAETPENGGYPAPSSVRLCGDVSSGDMEALSLWLTREIGIPSNRQEWIELPEEAAEKEG